MMEKSNETLATVHAENEVNLLGFVGFAIQGTINFLLNFPTFLTVAKYTALNVEKHFIIVAGLALADAANGFAYACCGIYRCILIYVDAHKELVSSWQCTLMPHNLLWVWTDTVAPLMLMVVSVDRFVSVAAPIQYLRLPRDYALALVVAAYGYSWISGAVGIFSGSRLAAKEEHSPFCYLVSAVSKDWYAYYGFVNALFAFSSVLVYFIVGVIGRISYRQKLAKLMKSQSAQAIKQQAQQQEKMTESLAISCFFTFFLFCVPYSIGMYLRTFVSDSTMELSTYLWILSNFNPMMNMVIYWCRHREVRIGVRALLGRRQMPPTLHGWLINHQLQQAAPHLGTGWG